MILVVYVPRSWGVFIRWPFYFSPKISSWVKEGVKVLTSKSEEPQKNVVNLYRSTPPVCLLRQN